MIVVVLLPMLMGATFLFLIRHWRRRQLLRDELSPISRQHIDLYQGVQLSESAVESAKARFRELLERGEVDAVEASLRAGMQYVVQVRALAELGTDDAGRILERQLQRRLTDDAIEQAWYWIDLANGLRSLNRAQSLPHLLRCSESAGDLPLGHFFAAETICFLGFIGYLRETDAPLGRAALRVLHRALEGLRFGVQPTLVAEARVGEMIEALWDDRHKQVDPLVVRVFVEALRVLRRAPHAESVLAGEASEQEAFGWQMSRLAALEPVVTEYLADAPAELAASLSRAAGAEQRDLLLSLIDLRAETAAAVLPLLAQPRFPHAELALESLMWSSDPRVGPALREMAFQRVPLLRRSQRRRSALPPPRPSAPPDFPYRSVLRALRGQSRPANGRPPAPGGPRLGPDVPGGRGQQSRLVGAGATRLGAADVAGLATRSQPGRAPGRPRRPGPPRRTAGVAMVPPDAHQRRPAARPRSHPGRGRRRADPVVARPRSPGRRRRPRRFSARPGGAGTALRGHGFRPPPLTRSASEDTVQSSLALRVTVAAGKSRPSPFSATPRGRSHFRSRRSRRSARAAVGRFPSRRLPPAADSPEYGVELRRLLRAAHIIRNARRAMIRAFWRWGTAAALGGALLGCTRTVVQQKAPPPDPLLVSRKPVEGKPLPEDADLSARLQPPAPPSSGGDLAAAPDGDAAPVRPTGLRLGAPQAGGK